MSENNRLEDMFVEEFLRERTEAAQEIILQVVKAMQGEMCSSYTDGLKFKLNDALREFISGAGYQHAVRQYVAEMIKRKIDGVQANVTIQYKTVDLDEEVVKGSLERSAGAHGDSPPPPSAKELQPSNIELQKVLDQTKNKMESIRDQLGELQISLEDHLLRHLTSGRIIIKNKTRKGTKK